MTYELSDERRSALLRTLPKERTWGSLVRFFDTVESLEELTALAPTFREHAESDDLWLLDYYRKNLAKWPRPQLDEAFRLQFPLVAERLDVPWKIRVFLRAADAREVPYTVMAQMFNELLNRHEVNGEKFVHYPQFRGSDFYTALRIVYHTQLPYWTACELILGKRSGWGCQVVYSIESDAGLHVWWDKNAWAEKFDRKATKNT